MASRLGNFPNGGNGLRSHNVSVTPGALKVTYVDTHFAPATPNVRRVTERSMLPGNPEITEHLIKGHTPRAVVAKLHAEGATPKAIDCVFGVGTPKASACAQDTRLGMPGQRTGRVLCTQGRAGVQS